MQKKILLLLNYTICFLNKWADKFNIRIIQNEDYQSLTPIDDADEDSTYANAILWALENRNTKNIRNIALTGSYGSGKSSIIKTFQKKYKESEYKFLNISLATFKDEINGNSSIDDGLLRLIELSILQQIFYHVENDKIPDSRFKKINSIGNKKLIGYSVALIIWLISISITLVPDLFYNLFRLKTNEVNQTILFLAHYAALVLMLIGIYRVIKKSIRIFNSSKINKLNIQSGEIEIDKEIDKSILNNHLDEILYFFEVNDFNVLVIEDLDRFGQTEIFTKLRELNNLINNSKQVNKEVVFIYAVRDDMFKDKDRTKFFDFIIPIIPVINSSNSNDILLKKLQVSNTNLSPDLIDDVSLFIDDMRLLNNIINEYKIYQKKLSNKLSEDKLLGMIVYKNIHPEDFVSLHNSKGKIYEVINKKQEFIKNEVSKVENEISDLEDKIDDISNEHFDDINELRALYILEYINSLTGIKSFTINGSIVDFRTACSDDNFDYFVKNNVSYNYLTLNYSNYYNDLTNKVQLKFSDVENKVNSDFTYLERVEFLGDKREENIEKLSKKIKELKDKISSLKSASLKDVLNNSQTTIIESEKDNRLINILLRGGYIDPDSALEKKH
jgi:peptidoglycan hydrolase CwlO-like protein